MIKLQDYTPEIYYKESRDFQFIGRLFDIVLNSVKTEADTVYNIPVSDNSDDRLVDLLAMTLGFQAKHHYSGKQLRALCRVFPEVLRKKGSIDAVLVACNAIFAAEGLEQETQYDFVDPEDKSKVNYTVLNLYIPQEFEDLVLLNDILTYILPAGMTCNLIKELRLTREITTIVKTGSIFKMYAEGDTNDASQYYNRILYNNNIFASIPRLTDDSSDEDDYYNRSTGELSTGAAIRALVKDKPGFIGNTGIYVPTGKIVPSTDDDD